MVSRLIASQLVPGVHFCTLNLEKSVRTILETLNWTTAVPAVSTSRGLSPSRHNKVIEEDAVADDDAEPLPNPNGLTIKNGPKAKRRASSVTGMSISPSEASQLAQWGLTNGAMLPAPKKGQGTQGGATGDKGGKAEDSWDEYPNGRFTDVRSPAYGEIDGYGSGLKTGVSAVVAGAAALCGLVC